MYHVDGGGGGGGLAQQLGGAAQLLLKGGDSIHLDTGVRQGVPLRNSLWEKRIPELFGTHT